jgi:hypothetical protein
MPLSTAYQLEQ